MSGPRGKSSGKGRSFVEADLHLSIVLADGVDADAPGRGAAKDGSGAKVELGVVPGTGDAPVLNRTEGDGGIGMRAKIVEGVNDAVMPDEGDAVTLELIGASLAFLKVDGSGDFLELRFWHPLKIRGKASKFKAEFTSQGDWGGSSLAQAFQGDGAVPFGETVSRRVGEERMVVIGGNRETEECLENPVEVGRVE